MCGLHASLEAVRLQLDLFKSKPAVGVRNSEAMIERKKNIFLQGWGEANGSKFSVRHNPTPTARVMNDLRLRWAR